VAKSTSKHSRSAKASKRYSELQLFFSLANLLPAKVTRPNAKETQIFYLIDGEEIAENDLPTINELCGILPAVGARKAPALNARAAGNALWAYRSFSPAKPNQRLPISNDFGQSYQIGPPHALQQSLLRIISAQFKRKFPGGVLRGRTTEMRSVFRRKIDESLYIYELFFVYSKTLKQLTDASKSCEEKKVSAFSLEVPARRIDFVCDPKIESCRDELFLDEFFAVIQGHDIQKFKRCPICGKFFIAWRIDKGACSPTCLALNRVRRHRERHPMYEETRKLKGRPPSRIGNRPSLQIEA
jgi:hypothetical protein